MYTHLVLLLILLLQHHQLLLLLEKGLELLFIKLIQELLTKDWHFYKILGNCLFLLGLLQILLLHQELLLLSLILCLFGFWDLETSPCFLLFKVVGSVGGGINAIVLFSGVAGSLSLAHGLG